MRVDFKALIADLSLHDPMRSPPRHTAVAARRAGGMGKQAWQHIGAVAQQGDAWHKQQGGALAGGGGCWTWLGATAGTRHEPRVDLPPSPRPAPTRSPDALPWSALPCTASQCCLEPSPAQPCALVPAGLYFLWSPALSHPGPPTRSRRRISLSAAHRPFVARALHRARVKCRPGPTRGRRAADSDACR